MAKITITKGTYAKPLAVRKVYSTVNHVIKTVPLGKQAPAVAKALKVTPNKAKGYLSNVKAGGLQPTINGAILKFPDNSKLFIGGGRNTVLASLRGLVKKATDKLYIMEFSEDKAKQQEAIKTYKQAYAAAKRVIPKILPTSSLKVAQAIRLITGSGSNIKVIGGNHTTLAGHLAPSSTRHYLDNKKPLRRI